MTAWCAFQVLLTVFHICCWCCTTVCVQSLMVFPFPMVWDYWPWVRRAARIQSWSTEVRCICCWSSQSSQCQTTQLRWRHTAVQTHKYWKCSAGQARRDSSDERYQPLESVFQTQTQRPEVGSYLARDPSAVGPSSAKLTWRCNYLTAR